MTLPQIQGGLERYLNELPEKIEFTGDREEGLFLLSNGLVTIDGYFFLGYNMDFSTYFDKFVMPQNWKLDLSANYFSQEKRANVWGMRLTDMNDKTIDQEMNAHCSIEEFMKRPYLLHGATDFLNRVLDRYNFHRIYEEFEIRRNQAKINDLLQLR